MNDREQRVRECAYFLWEEEKCPDGRAEIHWQMAEIAITLVDYLKASQQERTAEPVSAQSIGSTFQPVLEGRAFTDPPHFPWKNHSGSTCGS